MPKIPVYGSYLIPRSICSSIPKPKLPKDESLLVLLTTVGEVSPSELVVLDAKTLPEDLVGFLAADGDVTGHFLVSLDAEGTDRDPGLGGNRVLAGEVLEDLLRLHELIASLAGGQVEHELLDFDRSHGVVGVFRLGHCSWLVTKDLKICGWVGFL